MLETIEATETVNTEATTKQIVDRVCGQIPPLWDLRNYVAVNPFLSFASQPLDSTARLVEEGLDASVLPNLEYYRSRWRAGEFRSDELIAAAQRSGFDAEQLTGILEGRFPAPQRTSHPVYTLAERLDHAQGSHWNDIVIRSAARWCSTYAAQGGSFWRLSAESSLFAGWREMATIDRSLDVMGLRGFRRWAADVPEEPSEAIEEMLDRVGTLDLDRDAYFYRLLGGLYGGSSYFRRLAREKDPSDAGAVTDLLAIRLCMDAAVHRLATRSTWRVKSIPGRLVEEESFRLVMQEALEDGFTGRLFDKFLAPTPKAEERPKLQAIFCIDVRSEPLRRHLEAESSAIETRGFAGFFGVTLNWHADGVESARCPVLLKPGVRIDQISTDSGQTAGKILPHMRDAPASAFSYVELLGLGYGLKLTKDVLRTGGNEHADNGESTEKFSIDPSNVESGIELAARVDLAAGILKNMGLRREFARLILLCGHEGHSANNPHAAGLDCGACGGHGGAINARVAAAILNDPAVRSGLTSRGWSIPNDTHFLPGVHDTSTDEVRLLDLDRLAIEHQADIDQLKIWLRDAGAKVRSERATRLGIAAKPPALLERLLKRRACDWSEVRPEWGLARNAAFIAARRSRTRGVDLDGRAFLHEYDATTDPDDSILTLILSAPMVVASWINLQYFASTVDNTVFGAGDKALHNRIGAIGVVLGNGGDLRGGLPLQSVHSPNGTWFHEPIRLQVVVEADTEKLDRVLAAQPVVKDLVENGWVRLFSLDCDSTAFSRYVPGVGWENTE